MSRTSAAGTFSQSPWGGKLGSQQGSRGFVGEGQPTDPLAAGQRDPFFGIDLPDLMGFCGTGDWSSAGPRRAWAIDPRPDERLLESADGRYGLIMKLFDQLNTN
jgi:hypothetical protein